MLVEKTKHLRKDFTATGYVTNSDKTKLLVIFHNKLQKWLPAGGHLESNELPHQGAIREVFEETGILAQVVKDDHDMGLKEERECQIPRPYSILYQIIPSRGKDVEHIHVDFVYILEAEETTPKIDPNEVSKAKWMTKDEVLSCDSFDSVKGFVKNYLKDI
jgi:8-oxo-dGTP pyrophosphatase MutT (NUDIX family)